MASLYIAKWQQFSTDAGAPLNGGKLLWSLTTTTTAKNTFPTEADAIAGTNANVNPIILDSDGRSPVEVWIVGRYRLRTYTSADVLIADDDPIEDTVSASTAQQQAQGWGGNNSGTANALVFTYSPAITSYVAGTPLRGRILADNTTAVTVNAGAGVKSLVKQDGTALAAGDLQGPDIVEFVYDSTSDVMRLLSPNAALYPDKTATVTANWTFSGDNTFSGKNNFFTRIQRQVAASVAQIDFVLPSGFTQFFVLMEGVLPATDAVNLTMRASTDSGVSFVSAGTYAYNVVVGLGSTSLMNVTHSAVATSWILTAGATLKNTAGEFLDGRVDLFGFNTARKPRLTWAHGSLSAAATFDTVVGSGQQTTSGTYNAIRFLMSSGNIASGTFTLYGAT